jgi:SAM-dependent methyltransferase
MESNIRYVQGDFRDFHLDGTFDAAICGSDSLNYVNIPDELADVFRSVRRHLRPGGLFAFDVLDRSYFHQMTGTKIVAKVGEEQFELYSFYDPVTRVNEARVVYRGTVEGHRRVPIIEAEVVRAAREAKLECLEHFSRETYNFSSCMGERQFYVLRAPRS